jgi:hypothetical protein
MIQSSQPTTLEGGATRGIVTQACLFLFIALSPIEDFFLAGTSLRLLGRSLSLFPLLWLALASLWSAFMYFRADRRLLLVLLYAFLISVYGVCVFGFISYGENMVVKGFSSFISLGLFLFAIFGVDYGNRPLVRFAVYTAFVVRLSKPIWFPRTERESHTALHNLERS